MSQGKADYRIKEEMMEKKKGTDKKKGGVIHSPSPESACMKTETKNYKVNEDSLYNVFKQVYYPKAVREKLVLIN